MPSESASKNYTIKYKKIQEGCGVSDPVSRLPYVNPKVEKLLKKLGIETIQDLLLYSPSRYLDFSNVAKIEDVRPGEIFTIQGQITSITNKRTWKRKLNLTEAIIKDGTGSIKAIWFNQPFIAHRLKKDQFVNFSGKIAIQNSRAANPEAYFSNPAYEALGKTELAHTGRIIPIYPETAGLTSRWIRFLMKHALKYASQMPEIIPQEINAKENFPAIKDAVKNLHFPNNLNDALKAKKQFAFQELLITQLVVLNLKRQNKTKQAPPLKADIELIKNFISKLPFDLTNAQKKSTWQILQDLEKSSPMNRLLNGDVGSGKTIVAAIAALNVVKSSLIPQNISNSASVPHLFRVSSASGYQVAYIAPTEILARQHFQTFCKILQPFNLTMALATGSENKIFDPDLNQEYETKKPDLLKKIESAEINIAIGTHALIQDKVKFSKLGLVIIDEQHRFGVNQRSALVRGTNAEQTQNNLENAQITNKLLYEELTYKIRNALFDVKKELGGGHKEIIYQKAVAIAFEKAKLQFSRETQISITYQNKKVGVYVPDFIVEDKIIVELKALTFTGSTEKKQIWGYLKGSKYHLALLANYGPKELIIDRIIYDTARTSAFVPQESALFPHLLSMTATPIPRTLMLTIYGDLDISILNEMPKNRQKIITQIILPDDRQKTYDFIKQEIKSGRQAFVICPRIESQNNAELTQNNAEMENLNSASFPHSFRVSSASEVKSVKEEYKKLSEKIFPDLKIGMLYGKLKPKEKEELMRDFKENRINILVSTSVIEVGIDIPNATVMMIEGADRFGLAQLHQFRGRIGRGDHQSYCFLMADPVRNRVQTNTAKSDIPNNTKTSDISISNGADSENKINNDRLQALVKSNNGFQLAQRDLELRGPGEFLGTRQSGLPDMTFASFADVFLIEKTKNYAENLLKKDFSLKQYPLIQKELIKIQKKIHLE